MSKLTLLQLLCCGLLTIGIAGCDVDVEDSGELPTVDVEPGEAPDVDVTGPDVDLGTEKSTVTVPDVDVSTEEKTVTLPDVDVSIPDENEN